MACSLFERVTFPVKRSITFDRRGAPRLQFSPDRQTKLEPLRGSLLFRNQLILLLRPILGNGSKQPVKLETHGLLPLKDRLDDHRCQQC